MTCPQALNNGHHILRTAAYSAVLIKGGQSAIGLDQQMPAKLVRTREARNWVDTYLAQIEHGVCV